MPIRKQEFYEGAALHIVARSGFIRSLIIEPPFVELNGSLAVLLKYSTRGRSPWGFSFSPDEQIALRGRSTKGKTVVGLICGSDGVVAIDYNCYAQIASHRDGAVWISAFRDHGEYYEISGPDGVLERKVAPSVWSKILELESLESQE